LRGDVDGGGEELGVIGVKREGEEKWKRGGEREVRKNGRQLMKREGEERTDMICKTQVKAPKKKAPPEAPIKKKQWLEETRRIKRVQMVEKAKTATTPKTFN